MTNLIDINDIQAVIVEMSANVESERMERFIVEAQEFDIKPVLGRALYLAFVNGLSTSPVETIYEELFNGKTYLDKSINSNISFEGVKLALIYYSYARFLNNQNSNVTAFGIVQKENDFSAPSDEKRIARLVTAATQAAEAYKNDFIKFLNDNSTDYPLWLKENTSSIATKGGINVSRVTKGGRNIVYSGKCANCGRTFRYCTC